MFEKFESWGFEEPTPEATFASAWGFWAQRGYQLTSTGPQSFQGRSFQSKIGIHRVVDVNIVPSGAKGTTIQLRFRADVRADVAAGGVVVAVLLFPVAAVGAAVSWHEYERDWSQERHDFWAHLTGPLAAKPAPGTVAPPPPASPIFGPTGTSSTAPAPPPPPPPGASTPPPPPPPPPSPSPAPASAPSPEPKTGGP